MPEKRDVIRETDAEAIRLARTLLRSARHGALAVLDPVTGSPLASRVGVATDADGTPVILISILAAHTRALIADPRCSLLLGDPGKGDALAHPRVTLACRAMRLDAGSPRHQRVARRYLNRNPKAKLYAELGDFSYFALTVESASLNGGFGKAYALAREDIILHGDVVEALAAGEQGALEHMNSDHRDAIGLYARHFGGQEIAAGWTIAGIDADGLDLVDGDRVLRIFFASPLEEASALRSVLVSMAKEARMHLDTIHDRDVSVSTN